MDMTEKQLSHEYIYKGRVINLRVDECELPDGEKALREVIEHPGGVCVAALTGENELLFVRQYRYPYSEVILELPAGKLTPGEDPLECGKRELLEETGAVGDEYKSLGLLYPSPGYCGEIIHLYMTRVVSIGETKPDDDEFVEMEKIPLRKAADMVLNNEIHDAKSQVAILKAAMMFST